MSVHVLAGGGVFTHIIVARFLGSRLARLWCLWWGKSASGYLLRLRGLCQQSHKVRQILLRRYRAALAGEARVALCLIRGLRAESRMEWGKTLIMLQVGNKLQL